MGDEAEALVPATVQSASAAELGEELAQRLVAEIVRDVGAGRQGLYIRQPERLRTSIFLRGYSLGDFARLAGIAPSTLSRVLAGLPIGPHSWHSLITTLDHTK